jgi:hypothetical protein
MSESQWPELTDTEWAARQARLALQDGRYRLAAAFANLAHRAQLAADVEASDPAYVRVPLAGTTREEFPRMAMEASAELQEQLYQAPITVPREMLDNPSLEALRAAGGPDPFGQANSQLLSDAQAAQTAIFGVVKDATAPGPDPSRCRHTYRVQERIEECRAGIYWRIGSVGDNLVPPGQAGWFHIDSEIDADHRATPHGSSSSV